MERTRHAEMKRQYDLVAKAALVNNIKVRIRRKKKIIHLRINDFKGVKKT